MWDEIKIMWVYYFEKLNLKKYKIGPIMISKWDILWFNEYYFSNIWFWPKNN